MGELERGAVTQELALTAPSARIRNETDQSVVPAAIHFLPAGQLVLLLRVGATHGFCGRLEH